MTRPVRIDVYTHMRNEERMLPYWLRHYGPIARKIVVFDNESSDRTGELARQAGCVVIPFYTAGEYVLSRIRETLNAAYTFSRGDADWVIVADGDEFVWHPDLPGTLARYSEWGITIARTRGYNMVSQTFPCGDGQIYDEVKEGVYDERYSKPVVFSPLLEMRLSDGCHQCRPEGRVRWSPEEELRLLHFKYLGEDYYVERFRMRGGRYSLESLMAGRDPECVLPEEVLRGKFREALAWPRERVVP